MALYKGNILERIISLDTNVSNMADIVIGPLHTREGAAIAQLSRQFLAHSIKGSAISGVKIDGVLHAFAVIPHVKEDVHYLISNLKKVVVKCDDLESNKVLKLQVKGRGVVTAGDLQGNGVTVINPDQELCTITDDGSLSLECLVTSGYSYMSEDEMKKREDGSGMILFGASYGPVKNVSYETRQLSVGSVDSLEELILSIETNGSLTPLEAVKIAVARLNYILGGFISDTEKEDQAEVVTSDEKKSSFENVLLTKISKLQLSARAQTCIKHYKIRYLGELVMLTSDQLSAVSNVGATSVNEIKDRLAEYGLKLETIVTGWPSGDELEKRAEAYEAEQG